MSNPIEPKSDQQPEPLERNIREMESERDAYIDRQSTEQEFAKKHNLSFDGEKFIKGVEGYEKAIDRTKDDLDIVYARIAEKDAERLSVQKSNAKKVDETIKISLRTAWLESGGDPDEFEGVYPELKREELMKRTRKATNRAQKEHGNAVRNMMSGT